MDKYMEIAKQLSDDNLITKNGGPFGACVVKDGRVIGRGSNHVLKNNDPTAHAEVMAIRDACKNIESYDLSGCELYTSCYPCPMCLSAIIWSNIKRVYYGNTKEDAANIGFRDDFIYNIIDKLKENVNGNDIIKLEQIERNETIKSFEKYSKLDNNTIY